LLRENVRKLGQIGELVDVKPGYARNYLLPQGLAYQPTEANLRAVEADKQRYLAEVARQRKELQALAEQIDGREVTIEARANEEGHLYGSVGPAQICAALAEQNVFVEPEWLRLPHPIRQLDKHDVPLDLDDGVTATIHVWVVALHAEGEEPAETSERQTAGDEAETPGEPEGPGDEESSDSAEES
jgi:large subunit ribosomal protein L9